MCRNQAALHPYSLASSLQTRTITREKLSSHIARHIFATTVTLLNGVPLESVSKMLENTNIRTTQIYAKVLDQKVSADMAVLKKKL
ncbi:tyrosine-type recombinase/integrase [Sphingobacterium sp. MYb382]|uniref:tyrosine-type recombinase/integrase n=1 Tax=Sphingobacterium sp. MYb382 TaxID=2745278 RepID=UPI00403F3019